MRLSRILIVALVVVVLIVGCLFAILMISAQSIRSATAAANAAGWTYDAETLRGRVSAQMGTLPDWGPVEVSGSQDFRVIDTATSGKGVMASVDKSGRVTQFWVGDNNLSSLSQGISTIVESAIPTAAVADKTALEAKLSALVQAGHPGHTDFVTVDGVTFSAANARGYSLSAKSTGLPTG